MAQNGLAKKIGYWAFALLILVLYYQGCWPLEPEAAAVEPRARLKAEDLSFDLMRAMRLIGMAAFSSYMALTAISFLRFRLPKKERDYARTLRALGMDRNAADAYIPAVRDEYTGRDYILPVAAATFASLMTFRLLLFHDEMLASFGQQEPMLLQGLATDPDEHPWLAQDRSMFAAMMGFLGAFMWCARDIARRMDAGDLPPTVYYRASLRIVFAGFTALVLAWVLDASPTDDYTRAFVPAIAFLAGMTPEQALRVLKDRVGVFSRDHDQEAALALEQLEGFSLFHKVRMAEEGVDNIQNLAEANLTKLLLRTPFAPRQLIDWVAQAKLFLYFRAETTTLRQWGVRTAFDLMAIDDEDRVTALAEAAGAPPLKLDLARRRLRGDPEMRRLLALYDRLGVPAVRRVAAAERSA